ncbi:MAG: zinc metallopeptidase [Kiritimatiellae bacterium]|nr:zinc metallopeptidase [Kiritimatiellia bacterium]MDD5520094.1 zinc metallopeptidase [Kiritimatiellia bacterium]
MYGFDYYIFMLPAMILAGLATLFTKTTFSRYANYQSVSGLTGSEAARKLFNYKGIHDVRIEEVSGFLSDHYDPASRTLRLSPDVYNSNSLSAIGVACHEAGHAIQHATGYIPLILRSALVPAVQIGTIAPYILFGLGVLMNNFGLIKLGALLFSLVVVFSLVTLPVEWNASSRAKTLMVAAGIVSPNEEIMAGKVLNAAFMTYIAAAFTSLLSFLYFLMRTGIIGRRDD